MSGNNDGWSFNRFNEYEAKLKGEKVEESTEEVVEEETIEEGIDFKGAAREQARRDAIQKEKDKKSPSSKDYRLAMRKFRPGASQEERASGSRDVMREKGTQPIKDGKKMFTKEQLEAMEATGLFSAEEIEQVKQLDEALRGKEYTDAMAKLKKKLGVEDGKRKEAEAAKLNKEELEATGLFSAEEVEALVEGSVQLDEISLKTKMGAYAATQGPDADYEYGTKVHDQGERIKKNIIKKHGEEAGKHAERHAEAEHYGRGKGRPTNRIEKNRSYRTRKDGKMHGQDQNKLKSDLQKRATRKEELEATGLFSAEEIEALVEASCGSKGYQKGGEVKCDKCEGKGCDHCEDKGSHKKSEKSGAKPDYLDFDKDGNKDEPMTKALKEKGAKKS